MRRRDFLKKGLAAAGGAVLARTLPTQAATGRAQTVRTLPIATAGAAGGFYTPNRAPLMPTAFQKLPTGSITPKGWLRKQLLLQADGLNGRMTEVSDYLKYDGNGWVDADSTVGWEEVPYWLKGFGDLGYVLGDPRIIALATKWVEGILAAQSPDGWFGPKNLRTSLDGGPDMWPHMPILNALQSYYEYKSDPRVLAFMTKYFAFQNAVPGPQFHKSWAGSRFGDNLESVYWLYNRTGDASLLDLARKMHENMDDWTGGVASWHNVDFSQGFREPAEYWLQSQDVTHRDATYRNYETVKGTFGQFAGGGFAGDENIRQAFRDPRQGFETCGIVEFMHSFEMLTRITGDPVWADRCEEIAFNSLPAAFDPMQKGTHYITSANSIQLDGVAKGNDFNNNWPMQVYMPGVHNYRCCPHNYGMGWPYYAEEMWLATADKGLCASLYGASEVKARVGDGTTVHIAQNTDYPFSDAIQMTLSAPQPVTFPLYLRIPRWCSHPTVRINGTTVAAQAGPSSYLIVERAWKNGDSLTLHLPMTTSIRAWAKNHDSVSVDHGPLTFSLALNEQWNRSGGTDQWPEYSVLPKSDWNYGLVLDQTDPGRSFDVVRKAGTVPDNPWTHETNPLELRAKARKIPGWQADQYNVVGVLQPSPAKTTEPLETVTLIPMGAARLRITSFPLASTAADAYEWQAPHKPDMAITASFVHDDLSAVGDGLEPAASHDDSIPRLTFWDHKGTAEWVQYDYPQPICTSSVSVYWYDDTGAGQCRVPQSWKLLYKDGDTFKPVTNASGFGVDRDKDNQVTFSPVTTTALRLELQLQDGFSGGILEWTVDHPKPGGAAPLS